MRKRFFIRLFIFLLPFLLIFSLFLLVSWRIGYLYPLASIVEIQQEDEFALFDLPLRYTGHYKALTIAAREPDILVFGSSRVLGFRDDFCNLAPERFYNAGVRAMDVDDMLQFGEIFLDSHSPKVLLLSLDQIYFNADSEFRWVDIVDNRSELEIIWQRTEQFAKETRRMSWNRWEQLLAGRELLHGNLGIQSNAILEGIGFRGDGSYQFGRGEYTINRETLRLAFGVPNYIFDNGNRLNEDSIRLVDELLSYAAARNVQVIGFFPPFNPHDYNEYFSERHLNQGYLDLASQELTELFASYNFSFHDFTNPVSLGIGEEMMLDAWHLSERSSLMLYLRLLDLHGDDLGSCSEADVLSQALNESEHSFLIFPPYFPE